MSNRRAAVIQAVYDEWERDAEKRTRPDPQYAHDGDTQYVEGQVALSAPTPDQDTLARRVNAALKREGLPTYI